MTAKKRVGLRSVTIHCNHCGKEARVAPVCCVNENHTMIMVHLCVDCFKLYSLAQIMELTKAKL